MSFWDAFEKGGAAAKVAAPTPVSSAQDPVVDVCDWCGYAGDDVLLGVCSDCIEGD